MLHQLPRFFLQEKGKHHFLTRTSIYVPIDAKQIVHQGSTMGLAKEASLSHISRESSDIERLAQFYQEVLGFERIENPKYSHEVLWLRLGPSLNMHLIERDPNTSPAEGPWSIMAASNGPKDLPRGHHICFSISNFDSFVQNLKEKGIEVHERPRACKKTNPVYFLDPDGNGLEVVSADDEEE